MNKDTWHMIERLKAAGISEEDAIALRRISMTLHRWQELECGTEGGCISRRESDGKPFWESSYTGTTSGRPAFIPDREAGALKRLATVMARYPGKSSYVQTDPRGASLYILKPGDVPDGANVESCYSNGIAVYR